MKNRLYNLRCRGEKLPINITDNIYFTWQLTDCTEQIKFEIEIFLENERIFSLEKLSCEQIAFIGNISLESLALYRYEITVTTDAFTETASAYFRAGLQNGFDKSAEWITAKNHNNLFDKSESRGIYLTKSFSVESLPSYAVAFVCGLGLHELYINGKKVGDSVLEPAFTDYEKRVLYSTYDVIPYLTVGENSIEVLLANGWYNQTAQDTWGFSEAVWRAVPKLLFQLELNGERIVSDLTWKAAHGELISSVLRTGEFYDFTAQKELFEVTVTDAPKGVLTSSYLPPIRECEVLKPVGIYKIVDKNVYDFGKNISGYCSFSAIGKRGGKVYSVCSERLNGGVPDEKANAEYIKDEDLKFQTDGCILSGKKDFLKPKFTYHGFRYAAVYGDAQKIKDVKAYFVHTDLKRVGKFECSSERLNILYNMSINSVLSNYHGMPTDCPHREKNAWTGDAQLSLETCIYNFDMLEAYRKWLDDFIDNQTADGQLSIFIPSCGWGKGCWPSWEIAFYRLPLALMRFYGDCATVKKLYPYLKKHFAFVETYSENGLVEYGLGDWCYPKKITFDICPQELTSSLNYLKMAEIMTVFSEVCEPETVDYYRKKNLETKTAILKKYSNEKSLTGLASLTYFGVLDKTDEIIGYLGKHGNELHCGILGVKYLFDVLGKTGRTDILFKILNKDDYPSFGFWAKNGQTSLCEDFEMSGSLNHHMYSCIAEYMIKYFCGVSFSEQMRTINLSPKLPLDLEYAAYKYDGLYGAFAVKVFRRGERVITEFSVPPNGEVRLDGVIYKTGKYEVICK